MKHFLRRRKKAIIFGGIIATLFIIIASFSFQSNKEGPSFAVAKRGDITQIVSVTGKVKAVNNINLAFDQSGRIGNVYTDINDHVSKGQALVELVNTDWRADVVKAEADQTTQEAKLNETEIALFNYYDDVLPILRDAYTKSNDAIRKQLDELFTNDERENVTLTFQTSNAQFELDAEARRHDLTAQLDKWQGELNRLETNHYKTSLEAGIKNARNHLDSISAFLDTAMNTVLASINLNQSTITTYKANITTAQDNINSVRADVRNIDQNINAQKAARAVQKAAIMSAVAATKTAKAKLAKTILRAPFRGIIVKQEADVGEIFNANETVVSIISEGIFEIESFIPEVDIANLKVGDPATITLDAYSGDTVFNADVVSIDPAETIIEGVSTYKTILRFAAADKRIKPGMTANIDIQTAAKKNVLIVPQRAVVKQDGKSVVRVIDAEGAIQEIPVTTGLRGSNGNIEITEGIGAGDKVITFLPSK